MQPGPDMNALLQQAQQMQAQLAEAQQEIAASTVDGQAGGGLVTVSMRGTGEVTGVTIDPKVVDPEDIETLQDLLVGAFGDAHTKVQELAESRTGNVSARGPARSGPRHRVPTRNRTRHPATQPSSGQQEHRKARCTRDRSRT